MKEKKIGAAMRKGHPQVMPRAQELPLSPVVENWKRGMAACASLSVDTLRGV